MSFLYEFQVQLRTNVYSEYQMPYPFEWNEEYISTIDAAPVLLADPGIVDCFVACDILPKKIEIEFKDNTIKGHKKVTTGLVVTDGNRSVYLEKNGNYIAKSYIDFASELKMFRTTKFFKDIVTEKDFDEFKPAFEIADEKSFVGLTYNERTKKLMLSNLVRISFINDESIEKIKYLLRIMTGKKSKVTNYENGKQKLLKIIDESKWNENCQEAIELFCLENEYLKDAVKELRS